LPQGIFTERLMEQFKSRQQVLFGRGIKDVVGFSDFYDALVNVFLDI
jgi:hypothetical protein